VSLYRIDARRDDNEPDIIKALKEAGAQVEQIRQPCDLAVAFRARHFLIEVDNPESKYRKRKQKQLETFQRMKIPMVQTPDEALRAIGAVKA
jgi:DNA-binding transcriptional MerR regulator